MQTVLSGIRSTGHLHLGNYFGALRNFVKIQDDYNCFYFIADLHSLTTHPHPDDFHANVRTILAEYLAAGLDPDKYSSHKLRHTAATLMIQHGVDVRTVTRTQLYTWNVFNALADSLARGTVDRARPVTASLKTLQYELWHNLLVRDEERD